MSAPTLLATTSTVNWPKAVRAAEETDRDGLRRFLADRSPTSLHTRFHGHGFRPGEELLDLLLCRTVPGRALVLEHGPDIIGHAMWTYLPRRRDAAELGVLLAEQWHGCGLGSFLTAALLADAARFGIEHVVAPVLLGDRPTRRLVHRLLPTAEGTHDGYSVEFWARIGDTC